MSFPAARPWNPLLILFLLLATTIAGVSYRYHLAQKSALSGEVRKSLLAITEMKAGQIVGWRADRIGAARILMQNRMTLLALKKFMEGHSTAAERAAVTEWLDAVCRELHLAGLTLARVDGTVAITRGRLFGDSGHLRDLVKTVAANGDVSLTDLHTEPGSPPHLGLNIPLRSEPGGAVFGALLGGLDPVDSLYPLVQSWPINSRTGESLLVRREDNDIVFLGTLRKRPGRPEWLRLPLANSRTAAARAIAGESGIVEAEDYTGTPVIAAVQPVAGTSWKLVTKVDRTEALPAWTWHDLEAALVALSLILVAGSGVLVLWRRQELLTYRVRYQSEVARRQAAERYDAEREAMTQELERSMQLLGASESRFRNTFEQVAVGMVHVSLDGKLLRCNQRFCEITGFSLQELLGMQVEHLTHPDDQARELQHLLPVRRGERLTSNWTKRYVRKDGSAVWVAVTVCPLRTPGEPPQLLGVAEDISEQVRAQEALRQSEERFRQLVEHAPEGILVLVGLTIRYANPEAVRMFGAESAAQLVGTSILDRVHPDERENSLRDYFDVRAGQPLVRAGRLLTRMDGESFAGEIHAGKIAWDEEDSALAFFRDVTDVKFAEEERIRLEQVLRQAQKMESVGRLAGGVAHDFNNHLTVINGYCEMLLENLPPADTARQEVEEIRAAGERAAVLTQQLLAFSRKQIVEPRALLLNDVVEEFSRLVRRLLGDDVVVLTELDGTLYPVLADRGQMHQVLMNLAVNARDAMPGGGRIVVGTANAVLETADPALHDAKPGSYVVLTVGDTGAGMSADTLQKIFEPFFTTKPQGVGTGLGLATVYGIVEQSGGFIRVESEPGQGSTFRIYLPAVVGERVMETVAERPPAAGGGTEIVLVVEDQPEVRRLALNILRKLGYGLLEAANGTEALALAAEFPGVIDLLVTDVVMPGMTGRDLAEQLQHARPALRVLFISGYSTDVIASQGVLDAGVAYLPKPFAPADLAMKVREVLGAPAKRGRVLVIDDDEAVRRLLTQWLEQAGYEVLAAGDGSSGMRAVEESGVQLVITDLVMPEREGLETVNLLRKRYPEIRVIAISGAFGGDYLRVASALGAAATFAKPLQPERLLQTVRELIG